MIASHRSKNADRLLRLLLAALLVATSVIPAGCTGSSPGTTGARLQPVSIDFKETPAQAAERLALAMTKAKSVDELRPAAYEALARTGIAVRTIKGDYLAKTGSRTLSLWLFEEQANNLTLDFLEHQGWTLRVFTQAVAEHPEGPGKALLKRPETLGVLLREWAVAAEKSPDDPDAFAPLLLAKIAQARGGGSDFTKGTIQPDQVELTYLEIMILTAGAFAAPASTKGSADLELPSNTAGSIAWNPLAPSVAYANPCSWIEEKWGKGAQDFAEEGGGAIFEQGMDKVRDWLSGVGDGTLAGAMKTVGSVFKAANFLTSMIALYGGYSLTMTWNPEKAHYLGYDGGHGNKTIEVIANVSTRPQGDDATLDCLKWAGVEKPKSDSAKECTVEWLSLSGTPKHATIQNPEKQKVTEEGKAVLKLDMTTEKQTEAEKEGKIKNDKIVIQANLITYQSNPAKLASATLFGGTMGGTLEAAKAWINDWFPKRAVAQVPVEWHYLPRWRGVAERPDGTRWVFTSGEGLKSIWTVTLEGGPVVTAGMTWKVSGKGQFDMKREDSQTQFQRTMTTTQFGRQITQQQMLPMSFKLGGTKDAPTLEVTNSAGNNVVSSSGQSKSHGIEAGGDTTVELQPLEE